MSDKIGLPELIARLALLTGARRDVCERFMNGIITLVADKLQEGETIKIDGLGTFRLSPVEARRSVNIATGNEIEIPPHNKIVFVPAKEISNAINSPFAAFETIEILDEGEIRFPEEIETNETQSSPDDNNDRQNTDERIAHLEEKIISEGLEIGNEPNRVNGDESVRPEEYNESGSSVREEEPEETYGNKDSEKSFRDEESEREFEGDESGLDNKKLNWQSDEENLDDLATMEAYSLTEEEGKKDPADEEVELSSVEDTAITPPEAPVDEDKSKTASGFCRGFFWGLISSFLLGGGLFIIGFYCGWFGMNDREEQIAENKIQETSISPIENSEVNLTELPSSESVTADQTVVPQTSTTTETTAPEPLPTPASEPVVVEEEPVYDTVSTTRYLTTIAQEHYGNFNLWPYIYEENKAILGNPDRIKPGTRVVVPKLSKYNINPKNPADIKKAKRKGVEIYSKYR